MMRGTVAAYSQAHMLKQRMEQAGLTHGEEVRVNLRNVNVRPTANSEAVVYFCELGGVELIKRQQEGDGGPLPDRAEVVGLEFRREGRHDILGALLSSNGVLRVQADEQTQIAARRWFWK